MSAERAAGLPGPGTGSDFRVALVCMPFYFAVGPNPAIGLLRAIAERSGFPTDSYHLNLDLAAQIDPGLHDAICRNHHDLVGEWLFGVAAFGAEAVPEEAAYLEACPEGREFFTKMGLDPAALATLRREILPRFLDECAASIDWGRYRVVGFTSTFQQNVASLGLARRIKERWPGVAIVFGGVNLAGDAGEEFIRAFPFVDYVVVGDGDHAFPALLGCIASGTTPDSVPGLLIRTADGVRSSGEAQVFRDLDSLPTPSYDEFFARARRLGLTNRPDCGWALPFEASRGCWWGQKHQCMFCAFNQLGMTYRSKSPDRVLEELGELARRHGVTSFSAADSIMDMRYVEEFFARLREARTDFEFFWETKANLTREQLKTLQRGGVRSVQPGIESLSSHVLRLMRKGSTMLQNVRYLKWSRYYGLRVAWNLLRGFPGEREEDYLRELEVMKLISHLEPPGAAGPITLERFSPYFDDLKSFPITGVRPQRAYRYIYPPTVATEKVALFFDCEIGETVAPEAHAAANAWIEEWRRRWFSEAPDTLVYRRIPGVLFVEDNRAGDRRGTHTFREPIATIYAECVETMRRPADVRSAMAKDASLPALSEDEAREILDKLCGLGLMVGEDGWYLSLAIPANPNW